MLLWGHLITKLSSFHLWCSTRYWAKTKCPDSLLDSLIYGHVKTYQLTRSWCWRKVNDALTTPLAHDLNWGDVFTQAFSQVVQALISLRHFSYVLLIHLHFVSLILLAVIGTLCKATQYPRMNTFPIKIVDEDDNQSNGLPQDQFSDSGLDSTLEIGFNHTEIPHRT